jgi:hypothetical protein
VGERGVSSSDRTSVGVVGRGRIAALLRAGERGQARAHNLGMGDIPLLAWLPEG